MLDILSVLCQTRKHVKKMGRIHRAGHGEDSRTARFDAAEGNDHAEPPRARGTRQAGPRRDALGKRNRHHRPPQRPAANAQRIPRLPNGPPRHSTFSCTAFPPKIRHPPRPNRPLPHRHNRRRRSPIRTPLPHPVTTPRAENSSEPGAIATGVLTAVEKGS